jgi:glycosyltransferase involved in cell wall biosynthesis
MLQDNIRCTVQANILSEGWRASVICLCCNHARFVAEALGSVFAQTYTDIEVLIVDDASTDESAQIIQSILPELQAQKPEWRVLFLQNKENQGNCKAFNAAFAQTTGKYIIDFATDDVLLPDRVAKQVAVFEALPEHYGVIFSNAEVVDESGRHLKYHYPIAVQQKSIANIPQGDVYEAVLRRYFICTPTMMIRRSVLEALGGYNEDLSYEDFDFWVRSARYYLYHYQDEITTLRRLVRGSHSTQFYAKHPNPHLISTLKVCEKAFILNRNEAENQALLCCVSYHLRQAFFAENFDLVFDYQELLRKINPNFRPFWLKAILILVKGKIRVHWLYQWYLRLRR